MSYKNPTQRDIAQAIMDVNVRGNTLLRKKGLDTPLYTTTYDVCNNIKSLTPSFNLYFNGNSIGTNTPKDKIYVQLSIKPDEITVNSNNLPYTEDIGEIDMTNIVGQPFYYKNYLCWFTTTQSLICYNLETKIIDTISTSFGAIVTNSSQVFLYNGIVIILNGDTTYMHIFNIDDLSYKNISTTIRNNSVYPHRLVGNRLYIYGVVGKKPHEQYPNDPYKAVNVLGYNYYNIDTGTLVINVPSPTNLPENILFYNNKIYSVEFTDPGSYTRYMTIYKYDIDSFEQVVLSRTIMRSYYNHSIIYQTIINGIIYIIYADPNTNYIYYCTYNCNEQYNVNIPSYNYLEFDKDYNIKMSNYNNLKFVDYDNTIFILGGTKDGVPHKDLHKLYISNKYKMSSNVTNVFDSLPNNDYINTFTHIYNNKIYLLHQYYTDPVNYTSSYNLYVYDIGLLKTNGYIVITTGDGEEQHPLINHKNFKLNVNINNITYYDYNFNAEVVNTIIYKDGKWKLINT